MRGEKGETRKEKLNCSWKYPYFTSNLYFNKKKLIEKIFFNVGLFLPFHVLRILFYVTPPASHSTYVLIY